MIGMVETALAGISSTDEEEPAAPPVALRHARPRGRPRGSTKRKREDSPDATAVGGQDVPVAPVDEGLALARAVTSAIGFPILAEYTESRGALLEFLRGMLISNADTWHFVCTDAEVMETVLAEAKENTGRLKGWVRAVFYRFGEARVNELRSQHVAKP